MLGTIAALAAVAAASPINNPGDATFRFYDNPGCPFLHFASGVNVTSSTPSGVGPSQFFAYANTNGTLDFTGSSMQFHATGKLAGGEAVEVQFFINDDLGSVNLGVPANQLNLDVTGQFRFRTATLVGSSTCRTGNVTFHMTGNWSNTTSPSVTIPALTGLGSGACGGYAATLNTQFGLGTTGATLTMYKFSARNDATGLPLTGS